MRLRRALSGLVLALALTTLTGLTGAPAAVARTRHDVNRNFCKWENARAGAVPERLIRHAFACLINNERRDHGLPELRVMGSLDNSAQDWSNAMVNGHFFNGGDLASQLGAVGYNWGQAGQNIGSGFSTPRQMVTGWMGSPGHCQILLSPLYRDVGTGINRHPIPGVTHAGATWTADFGLQMGASSPSNNWSASSGCP